MKLLTCQNQKCGKEFEYDVKVKGRPKLYCPECQPLMTRERIARWKRGIKSERGPKKDRYGVVTDHYYEDRNDNWI